MRLLSVVEVQFVLVRVQLDILRDALAVESLHALHEYRLATLKVGTLLTGELGTEDLLRNLELGTLLKAVGSA